jgi:hypothetical protein
MLVEIDFTIFFLKGSQRAYPIFFIKKNEKKNIFTKKKAEIKKNIKMRIYRNCGN